MHVRAYALQRAVVMKANRDLRRAALAMTMSLLMGVGFAACSSPDDPEPRPPVGPSPDGLIGNVPVESSALDSIAALSFAFEEADGTVAYEPFCTATLIGPQAFLTAKHCVDVLYLGGESFVVAIGPDPRAPRRVLRVVDSKRAPGDSGGFVRRGRDVGVVYVAEQVSDLEPVEIASLEARALGSQFATVGYGVLANDYSLGDRRAGAVDLRALEGRLFELVFGSYGAFRDWIDSGGIAGPLPARGRALGGGGDPGADPGADPGSAPPGSDPELEGALRDLYDETRLLDGYEGWLGAAPGNTQPCYGDSGGPLVRAEDGRLRVYGVVSGGLSSRDLVCDYGGVYAIFGPEVRAFLDTSKQWVDPCGGVSQAGVCEGAVAKRCTRPFVEGPRRLTETSCALLGQRCGRGSDGAAACVDP